VGRGDDVVAESAEIFDARPDGRAADAETLGKFRAGNPSLGGAPQSREDLSVDGHVALRFEI